MYTHAGRPFLHSFRHYHLFDLFVYLYKDLDLLSMALKSVGGYRQEKQAGGAWKVSCQVKVKEGRASNTGASGKGR